ncbi:MAG: radical SAM protein [Candidatus Kuenenia sp.]|nr:radical SAM protein [Candidatus Kuenenia hertensis]
MNILLIVTNRYRGPTPVIPLGACMIADSTVRAGHHVHVLDLLFVRNPLRALCTTLDKIQPEVIGLSVRNIDNNDMQYPVAFYKDLKPLIDTIRTKTQATILLGGAAVGVMPEQLLNYTGADWVITGNGEVIFPEVLDVLSKNEEPTHVPGIAWRDNTGFKVNTLQENNFALNDVIPDFYRWINVPAYLSRFSTIPVQTKLGCHFQCVYCTYRRLEGNTYQLCDPEHVANAIIKLIKSGMSDIEFVDNVFNSPYEHALEICEAIAKTGANARFQTVELNPLFINDELLLTMERAGFVGIGITVESAANPVLERLKKGFTSYDIFKASEIVRKHKIPCLWIFMFGGPGETEETVLETLHFAKKQIRPEDVALFMIGIRIYPGTEIENIARSEGVLTVSPHNMLEPVFYFSPAIQLEWLLKTIRSAMSAHMNFMTPKAIGLPFLPAINRMGYWLGIKPPLWKNTRLIRRCLRYLGRDILM